VPQHPDEQIIAEFPPDAPAADQPDAKGENAVRWLSVPQLVRTAIEVARGLKFARYADKREAMSGTPREFYRIPGKDTDVWVDYVADTGDGFAATYATARCVAGGLAVTPKEPFEGRPKQADLLVFGGDEVYPVASVKRYEDRLNKVLRAAGEQAGLVEHPPLVALPGNHDWYDGLVAFRRNFCESWILRDRVSPLPTHVPIPDVDKCDDVGGWRAFQSRSYFAVQLTENWWLWGIDSQLDAPIDAEQLSYFRDAQFLLGEANLILCTATPSWLEAGSTQPLQATPDTPLFTLLWFIDRILVDKSGNGRDRLRLILTGDKHHYARYDPDDPTEPRLVTCGGGGAFLSSTHHLDTELQLDWNHGGPATRYRLNEDTAFPTRTDSKALTAKGRFLGMGLRNGWSLPLLAGAIGLGLFALIRPQLWVGFGLAAGALGVLLYVFALTGVKERATGWTRFLVAVLLAVPHLAGHVGAALLAWFLAGLWFPSAPPGLLYPGVFVVLVPLGTIVFATYLHLADLARCHTLEAFSGMRFEGYKSHLRIKVGKAGVTVHVVGMKTVDPATPEIVDTFEVTPRAI
jgi:hypothetical protein